MPEQIAREMGRLMREDSDYRQCPPTEMGCHSPKASSASLWLKRLRDGFTVEDGPRSGGIPSLLTPLLAFKA